MITKNEKNHLCWHLFNHRIALFAQNETPYLFSVEAFDKWNMFRSILQINSFLSIMELFFTEPTCPLEDINLSIDKKWCVRVDWRGMPCCKAVTERLCIVSDSSSISYALWLKMTLSSWRLLMFPNATRIKTLTSGSKSYITVITLRLLETKTVWMNFEYDRLPVVWSHETTKLWVRTKLLLWRKE